MQFQREKASSALFDEVFPLLLSHYQEVAHYKDIPLDPDWEKYLKLEEMEMLRIFTAREVDGKLCGYAVFFIHPNPHYRTSIQANQDVLYIDPSKRGFGKEFIPWCDEMLRAEGVHVVYHHLKAKPHLDFSPLLERIGYELIDKIYGRRLN